MKAPKAKVKASSVAELVAEGLRRKAERQRKPTNKDTKVTEDEWIDAKKRKATVFGVPTNKDKEMAMTETKTTAAAGTTAPTTPTDRPPGAKPVDVPPPQDAKETPKEAPKPLKVKVGAKGEEVEQFVDPTTIGNMTDVTAALGVGGQSVTSIVTYRYATTEVTDILAGGSHYFIKGRQGLQEVGGTADWGTGTRVGGR